MLAVLCASAVVVAVGWWGAIQVRTPAQQAAAAAPPPPSRLTAAVGKGPLVDRLSVHGILTARHDVSVKGGSPSDVVTRAPAAVGTSMVKGAVLAELSGRPVIALPGAFPAYRDLMPGMTGPDVAQLRTALGLTTPQGVKVSYDAPTAAAVVVMYRRVGYDAPAGLPMAEVRFIDGLPLTVAQDDAPVGAVGPSTLLRLTGGALSVLASVSPSQRQGLPDGREVSVTVGSISVPGVVRGLAPPRAGGAAGGAGSDAGGASSGAAGAVGGDQGSNGLPTIVVDLGQALPAAVQAGSGVDVEVEIGRSQRGVVVPVSAVWTGADQDAHVQLVSGAAFQDVPVTIELTSGGLVAVVPVGGRALPVGSKVVVSQAGIGPQPPAAPGSGS